MNATERITKLREGLNHALAEAQRVTEAGIKHRFADLGAELVKLGHELEKMGGARKAMPKRPVRKATPVVRQ